MGGPCTIESAHLVVNGALKNASLGEYELGLELCCHYD
jgi:hypothetical protein